jgi:hypothetical protein
MRSSPITVLTTWAMSVGFSVFTLTPGFPKNPSMLGVLSCLLHLSPVSMLDCSLISLSLLSVFGGSLSLLSPKQDCELFHTLCVGRLLSAISVSLDSESDISDNGSE